MLQEDIQNDPNANQHQLELPINEIVQTYQTSLPFKIHLIAASAITLLILIVWTIVAFIVPSPPWFIYVIALFGITLSIHFYLFVRVPMNFFAVHVTAFALVNISLFVSWAYWADNSRAAWFFYPLIGWGIFLAWHWIFENTAAPQRWLYMHLAAFVLLNTMFLILCIDLDLSPWFIATTLGLGLPALVHWWWIYARDNYFRLHLMLFFDLNLMIFFIWVITPGHIPWFQFILIPWAIGLAVHYKFFNKGSPAEYNPHNDQPFNPNYNPNEDQSVNPNYNPTLSTGNDHQPVPLEENRYTPAEPSNQ